MKSGRPRSTQDGTDNRGRHRMNPPAIIGMLVIYCLKDVSLIQAPHGLPELIAAACVVGLQAWKRNSILSILAGTLIYMALVQLVF